MDSLIQLLTVLFSLDSVSVNRTNSNYDFDTDFS